MTTQFRTFVRHKTQNTDAVSIAVVLLSAPFSPGCSGDSRMHNCWQGQHESW